MSKDLREIAHLNLLKNSVWLAYEAWTDPLESRPHNAFGYQPVGYFDGENEEEAWHWVEVGGTVSHDECWAVPREGAPRRRLEQISRISMKNAQLLPGTRKREDRWVTR